MQRYFKILEPDSDLLASFAQAEGMTQLQEEILMQIASWIEEYTPLFCKFPWSKNPSGYGDTAFGRRADKLWNTWKLHCKDAQMVFEKKGKQLDLLDVAKQIQQEKGYQGKGKLGGNPFRDILLVDQIIQGDQTATTFFYNTYKPLAMKIKRDEDWWQEFNLEYVLQKKEETDLPAIANYTGRAGLSRWINKTGVRFLIKQDEQQLREQGLYLTEKKYLDILLAICTQEQEERYDKHFHGIGKQKPLPKPEQRIKWLLEIVSNEQNLRYQKEIKHRTITQEYQEYDTTSQCDVHPKSSPSKENQWEDCLKILGRIVLDLLNSFPDADALILKLRFLDGLTQDEIGAVIEKSKGQISKDLKRLEADLFEKLSTVIPVKIEEKEKCEACLELLKLPSFFTELAEWLKETYGNAEQEGEEQ